MNKKEVAEVKKQFSITNSKSAFNKMLTAYVTEDHEIGFMNVRHFMAMPDVEQLIWLEAFKKSLGGSIGKNLLELTFPIVNGTEGPCHNLLYEVSQDGFSNSEKNEEFIKHIVDGFDYAGEYFIAALSVSYSIPVSGKNTDEDGEDSEELYDFVITAICPINKVGYNMCLSADKSSCEKCDDTKMEVGKPIHGILFPTFNDRSSDVHSVMYFTAKPKEMSHSIIEKVLGCGEKLAADEQKEKFNNMLARVLDADSTFNVTAAIHQELNEIIGNHCMESDPVELNQEEIKKILERSGVDESNLEEFDDIYEEEVGDGVCLTAVNITNESAMKVNSPDIKINVKPKASEKVKAQLVDGKRCLVITLDETVEVNGVDCVVR